MFNKKVKCSERRCDYLIKKKEAQKILQYSNSGYKVYLEETLYYCLTHRKPYDLVKRWVGNFYHFFKIVDGNLAEVDWQGNAETRKSVLNEQGTYPSEVAVIHKGY